MKNILSIVRHLLSRPRFVIGTLLMLVVVLIGFSVFSYNKVKKLENPNQVTNTEIKTIIKQVGKAFVLPENETPTLATVSEPEKLRNQAFFSKAEVGDKVLIYTLAKRAILWRPSISKVIEISNLNTGAGQE